MRSEQNPLASPPVGSSARRPLLALFLLVGAALTTSLLAAPQSGDRPRAPVKDPLPIRRLLIPAERVPAELERGGQGVLRKLSRDDFEARVREAARALQALRHPPRLIEAGYTARLAGQALAGTGRWTVLNPTAAGILPLPDLNLALRGVKFESGAADAVLGDLDGKALGLLVKGAGKDNVVFDWTARGEPGSDGLHFKLKVPPCAVASLELTLPADRLVTLASRSGSLLTRPDREREERDHPREFRWLIQFSGRSEVDLVVHATTGSRPLVFARTAARQDLTPDRLEAEFKVQAEVLHNVVRKLYFACDPALTPYDVAMPNAELRWDFLKAGRPNAPAVLAVELREPVCDAALPPLTVRCRGPLTLNGPWASPALRLVKALPWGGSAPDEKEPAAPLEDRRLVPTFGREETLELHVHPDLRLERWQPGTFHLTRTESGADQSQVVTLTGGASANGVAGPEVRPQALLRMRGHECLARQLTWWKIDPPRAALTAQVTYELARGQLFELRLGLPAGWAVDQVTLDEEGGGTRPGWTALAEKGRRVLVVTLPRPLRPQAPAHLTVRLRGRALPAAGLAFPDVEPLDADFRTGGLAVSVHPDYQAVVAASSVPATPAEEPAAARAPWGSKAPTLFFPIRQRVPPGPRDQAHPGVTGLLRLHPYPARVRARCHTDVVLGPDQASAEVRLHLHPEVGSPDVIGLSSSDPIPAQWSRRWQTVQGGNRVREVVPRPGHGWRLVLAEPLREPLVLKTSFPLPAEALGRVPLLAVPAADLLEGEVAIYLAGTDVAAVTAEGLRETPLAERAAEPDGALPWRGYRYGHALLPDGPAGRLPRLGLARRPRAAGRSPEEVIDQGRLTTVVRPDGRLRHHFAFRAWNWRDRTLAVRLPAGSVPLAVKAYGRWIPNLPRAATKDGPVLALPVAAGVAVHPFEIVYAPTEAGPAGAPWARLEAPAPVLPVPPLTFRRTWQLPAGLVPVGDESLHRLPGPASPRDLPGLEALLAFPGRQAQTTTRTRQRQAMLRGSAELARRPRDARLGAALNRLDLDSLRGQTALVLDAEALRAAGLRPDTPLPPGSRPVPAGEGPPVWEEWGLVYVFCPGAALLTTRQERDSWPDDMGQTRPVSASIDQAVLEAAAFGHDGSGRFRTVGDWLSGSDPAAVARPAGPGRPDSVDGGADGTAWAPLAGAEDAETLWVVSQDLTLLLGLALAGALLLAAWPSRRLLAPRWRFRLLISWLACFGLALVWLPAALRDLAWWPLLAGSALGLAWYLWSTAAGPRRPPSAAPKTPSTQKALVPAGPVTAAVLALAGLTALAGAAAAPAPYRVLLVPGPAEAPDRQTALVPPELLDRLAGLTRRGVAGLRGAVLLGAEYHGKVAGGTADFEAEFQVYCFDKKATLFLPLAGVDLRQGPDGELALFAGRPVFPAARARPQAGYAIPVQVEEAGIHPLKVRFTVPVPEADGDRALRFTIPALAQSRLDLRLPAGANDLADRAGLGAETVTPSPHAPRRLAVDLGRVGRVHVRWRSRPPRPGAVQVQEAYLWDLREPHATLSGVLQYTVSGGAVAQLPVFLPEGTEVRSVEARRWPLPGGETAAKLLNRDWHVTGQGPNRRLVVNFHRPVTGGIQVILELVPLAPVGPGGVTLALPRPLGAECRPGALAYRLKGLEVQELPAQHLSLATLKPATFARDWPVRQTNDPGPPTRAYSFQRPRGVSARVPAVLRLTLLPPPVQAAQTLLWRVGLQQADLEATAVLTAPGPNLMFLEWEAPGVVVTEVSGPRVGHWTRAGGRVQVWLKAPCARAEVRLGGWAAVASAGKQHDARLTLPCLRLLGVRAQDTTVRVTAVGGLALAEVERDRRNLARPPEPAKPAADRALVYTTQQPVYQAAFEVRPARAAVRGLTQAEVRDRRLVFRARLDYTLTRGELRSVRVRLRHWYGDEVRVEGAEVAGRQETRQGRGDRLWTLRLRPGIDRHLSVRLSGAVPLDAVPALLMPEVSDETAADGTCVVARKERWLALAGPGLTAADERGLRRLDRPPPAVRAWLHEWNGPAGAGPLWQAGPGPWHLRLHARPAAGAPRVRLVGAEQAAAVADGRRWLYRATYWLYAEAGADLRLTLPAGARVQAVSLDGRGARPRPAGPRQLALSFPGGPGGHVLQVSWVYPPARESIARPNLAAPLLEDDPAAPLWTVHVPVGYRASAEGTRVRRVGAAGRDLHRADVQLRLSALLIDQLRTGPGEAVTTQLLAAQERFSWYCRQAEHRLALANPPAPERDPDGRPPADWLRRLREQNRRLLAARGLEKVRAQVEKQARDGSLPPAVHAAPDGAIPSLPLPEQGTPTSWQADPAARPFRLHVVKEEDWQNRQALAATGLLLAFFLGAWALSYVPLVLTVLHRTWPEQILLLGWLAWQVGHLPLAGAALLVLGVAARLFLVVRWAVGLLNRMPPATPAGGTTTPV